ncbi:hypothetical protein A3A14_02885 [Candidatus Daviesbacteria bacterium RIFCSPLOWO2_01_FULL_43_38]|nr:MAG: hypothetical protein A2874_03470 [Candidatus Daviesbacteria bacterium RIFCSPHIGHO2_01_FULL_43_17]OGE63574.1 MAG: hypothetical protein A3A14_02885 [Candidatus Daviesbacteria bacterium RIFCSPLOWO2_01_FULL_43_38]
MQRIPLKASEREVLGKEVKKLRRDGIIPGHIFGNKVESEHISVKLVDFVKVFHQAGETGLVDLKVGEEKIRPVLIRDVQVDPVKGSPLHIDFYQVNLLEKVTVPVPVVLIGDEPEIVHTGEAVVIQPVSEVEVEALPAELPEKIEVDITSLKAIDDAILVSQLSVPEGVTILADPEVVVVKLDNAVTEEMKQLMEEQAAEQAAAAEAAAPEEGAEAPASAEATAGEPAEGEEGAKAEGEAPTEGEQSPDAGSKEE